MNLATSEHVTEHRRCSEGLLIYYYFFFLSDPKSKSEVCLLETITAGK